MEGGLGGDEIHLGKTDEGDAVGRGDLAGRGIVPGVFQAGALVVDLEVGGIFIALHHAPAHVVRVFPKSVEEVVAREEPAHRSRSALVLLRDIVVAQR